MLLSRICLCTVPLVLYIQIVFATNSGTNKAHMFEHLLSRASGSAGNVVHGALRTCTVRRAPTIRAGSFCFFRLVESVGLEDVLYSTDICRAWGL